MPDLTMPRPLVRFLPLVLLFAGSSAMADDYLMFGPSLAVVLAEEEDPCEFRADPCRQSSFHTGDVRGEVFEEDESHFATDAGHNVTIVDAVQWAGMTTEQFAAFDAIVIGDAGCDFDNSGARLQPLLDNINTWSAAVTGYLFLHTFDNVYHYNNNEPFVDERGSSSEEQFQAMRDLAVDGMEFAASGGTTGLYYANGCRDFESEVMKDVSRGASVAALDFLAQLAAVTIVGDFGDDEVTIVEPSHPAMTNLTNSGLSNWGDSFHAYFLQYDNFFTLLATGAADLSRGEDGPSVRPANGDVILASTVPLGGSGSILPVPSAGPFGLSLFAVLLGLLGWIVVARRS